MANYMAEVAKLLGVELGECFEVYKCDGVYFLENSGLYEIPSGFTAENVLIKLLSGEYHIKRKPWKPNDNEEFYVVISDGDVRHKYWDDCATCKNYYKLGNCYSTKEEAEASRDKWLAFYASDEVLEV